MAEAIPFPESNTVFKPPPGSTVLELPAHHSVSENITISKWRLSKAEIAEVARTGDVWLIMRGAVSPAMITGSYPFQRKEAAS